MRIPRLLGIAVTVITVALAPAPVAIAQSGGGVQINPPAPAPAPPPSPPPSPRPQPSTVQPAQGCQTQWGICRVGCCIAPGTPCYCQGAKNTALPGYAVEFFRPTQ